MYAKDKYQNHNQSKHSQYMVNSAMEKLLVESDYEEEGKLCLNRDTAYVNHDAVFINYDVVYKNHDVV